MATPKVKRYGQLIGLKPEAYEKYVEHHANVWPQVLKTIYRLQYPQLHHFLQGQHALCLLRIHRR